jgi:hypothetical protein
MGIGPVRRRRRSSHFAGAIHCPGFAEVVKKNGAVDPAQPRIRRVLRIGVPLSSRLTCLPMPMSLLTLPGSTLSLDAPRKCGHSGGS